MRLAISGRHHASLKAHLFPGDGNEAVAFLLCGRARRSNLELLVVRDIVPIPYNACTVRTPYCVTWKGAALEPILLRAEAEGSALVKVHSHPNGYESFSDTDNVADTETFSSIFGWLDDDAPLASLIMLPDGKLVGRSIAAAGIGAPIEAIRVAGDDFVFWHTDDDVEPVPEHAARIAQAFGEGTYRILRRLRIGVIGCSGTGSVVAEQLARNCVGELVLVDPDSIEFRNLNRILNSTSEDAAVGANKAAVQAVAIKAMRLGTKVEYFESDLMNVQVLRALSTCDVVFGCMDSIDGRHVLNRLASAYVIPLIDVGVRLEADMKGGIDSIWGAIHTVLPGGSSLLSRKIYDQEGLRAAFMFRSNRQEYEHQRKSDYVKNVRVDQPAVISVNMEIAAAAANEFLARVHPYRVLSNAQFAIRRICLSDHEVSSNEKEGEPCSVMQRQVGLGDQRPLLGMQALSEVDSHSRPH